jgi:C6 transcription factor Pro1
MVLGHFCNTCQALDIPCHFGPRPEWIDAGPKQQEMAQLIKDRVKSNGHARREHRAANSGSSFVITSQQEYQQQKDKELSNGFQSALFESDPNTDDMAEPVFKDAGPNKSSLSTLKPAWEYDFAMIYLDHVFPFLFPYYRPHILGPSRAWILHSLSQDSAVYDTMLSLSSIFFTLGTCDTFPGQRLACRVTNWDRSIKQSESSFRTVLSRLQYLTQNGVKASLLDKVLIMESISHLLVAEVFLGRSSTWNAHLEPAITLFEENLDECSHGKPEEPDLSCILEQLPWPGGGRSVSTFGYSLWNPIQGGFRFFTATLIFYDIVGSTSLGRTPRLRK